MKDDLHIDELLGPRYELALDLLREGKPFYYLGLRFEVQSDGELECGVQTTSNRDSLTEEQACHDFERAKAIVQRMLSEAAGFADAVKSRRIEYCLIDDYAIGIVTLCRLDEDELHWCHGVRPLG